MSQKPLEHQGNSTPALGSGPHTPPRFSPRSVAAAVLALALTAAACAGDDPVAAPLTGAASTTSTTEAAAAASTTSTTEAAAAAPTTSVSVPADDPVAATTSTAPVRSGAVEYVFDSEPSWSEVLDDLSAPELTCAREELGEAALDSVSDRLITSDDFPNDEDLSILSCLDHATVRAVLVAALVWQIEDDVDVAVSAAERACLQEHTARVDVLDLLASASLPEPDDWFAALSPLMGSLLECVPDVFISELLEDAELGIEDLGNEQRECLRAWVAESDWDRVVVETWDDYIAALTGLASAVAECIPDVFISWMLAGTGVGVEELGDEERECLRARVGGADWDGLAAAESEDTRSGITALSMASVAACAPDLMVVALIARFGLGELGDEERECLRAWVAEADWGRLLAGERGSGAGLFGCVATALEVGGAVDGTLAYGGEAGTAVDYFVFDAVEGESYELRVLPGTLEDPIAVLYDADGVQLLYDAGTGGSLTPFLFWSASSPGPLYVGVGGYGAGSYTLTVAVGDTVDDHGDWLEGATALEVGEAVEGSLAYGGEVGIDIDFFVFDAVEGESYELRLSPGTLDEPMLTLWDADGEWLGSDVGFEGPPGPRLHWTASSSGPLYVEVGGYGAGPYLLTVALQ